MDISVFWHHERDNGRALAAKPASGNVVPLSQIGILRPWLLPSSLFVPERGPYDAGRCKQGLELIPEEVNYLIQLFDQAL
jgi:hypothetical protein